MGHQNKNQDGNFVNQVWAVLGIAVILYFFWDIILMMLAIGFTGWLLWAHRSVIWLKLNEFGHFCCRKLSQH